MLETSIREIQAKILRGHRIFKKRHLIAEIRIEVAQLVV